MKVNILDTRFIYKTRIFKIWRIPAIIYAAFLLIWTSSGEAEILASRTIEILSMIFLISGFLLRLANQIIYWKTGTLEFKKDRVFVENYPDSCIINLDELKPIKLQKTDRQTYKIHLQEKTFDIKLTRDKYSQLIETMAINSIEIEYIRGFWPK